MLTLVSCFVGKRGNVKIPRVPVQSCTLSKAFSLLVIVPLKKINKNK